ncbi:O-glucosyltransferase rumi [Tetrabaena socialis]|uniref:O-glucosyltransferase rumi n=1 Tax=Tetrabaena socialis TaxID=47790 RepID=A0A2J7ZP55_9CHLO|nr:O-glucosyltransferase rumi [Tetrabaena socialis]|eukprot:PNH02038.1 O-glucosyltransferase rumi [Tetrabaena socialis]
MTLLVASLALALLQIAVARVAAPLPEHCEKYELIYPQIERDFAFWDSQSPPGISVDTMREAVRLFARGPARGMHFGFIDGKAYVLTPTPVAKYSQTFLSRQLVYLDVLDDLEAKYGHAIPNCEFVLVTTDIPNQKPSGTLVQQQELQQGWGPGTSHPHGIPGLPSGTYPIFRASKSDAYAADILIPHHDFYLLRYDTTVLNASRRLLSPRELPWRSRLSKAYAQYDMHVTRNRHPKDAFTWRAGAGDAPICDGPGGSICFVRRHFWGILEASPHPSLDVRDSNATAASETHLVDLHTPRHLALAIADAAARKAASGGGGGGGSSDEALGLLDEAAQEAYQATLVWGTHGGGGSSLGASGSVSSDGESGAGGQSLPDYLLAHARHKLLLHLDSHGLSSSLERLLALGSTVLVESSGYYGYYTKAMKPHVHFVPWWTRNPEEVFSLVTTLLQNDGEAAAKIGARGSDFARGYLTAEGRACYWLKLLQRLAGSLQHAPTALADFPHALPVRHFRNQHVLRKRVRRGQRSLYGQPFEP